MYLILRNDYSVQIYVLQRKDLMKFHLVLNNSIEPIIDVVIVEFFLVGSYYEADAPMKAQGYTLTTISLTLFFGILQIGFPSLTVTYIHLLCSLLVTWERSFCLPSLFCLRSSCNIFPQLIH